MVQRRLEVGRLEAQIRFEGVMRVQPRKQGGAERITGPNGVHHLHRHSVDADVKVGGIIKDANGQSQWETLPFVATPMYVPPAPQ